RTISASRATWSRNASTALPRLPLERGIPSPIRGRGGNAAAGVGSIVPFRNVVAGEKDSAHYDDNGGGREVEKSRSRESGAGRPFRHRGPPGAPGSPPRGLLDFSTPKRRRADRTSSVRP